MSQEFKKVVRTKIIIIKSQLTDSCKFSGENIKLKYPALLALLSAFSAQATVSINEIRIDQPSSDNDEYFELHGPGSDSLDGMTYLVISDWWWFRWFGYGWGYCVIGW